MRRDKTPFEWGFGLTLGAEIGRMVGCLAWIVIIVFLIAACELLAS